MAILSVSFHATPEKIEDWKVYLQGSVMPWAKNFCGEKRVLLSEIETEVVAEGKNYNLLLFFDNATLRNHFFDEKIALLIKDITATFGNEVVVFPSKLNQI